MPPPKRINVLVYAGTGASLSSVRHTTWSLRRLLGPHHAVLTVTGEQLLKEPWPASCALLVVPGGADLGYARVLDGAGNRRIREYVRAGGKYLGFCAGGYYGSARCEFEVGRKEYAVVGDRELAFWPGVCRGLAFKGFVYGSEAGARAVELKVQREKLDVEVESFKSYYNGGGVFVDAEKYADKGVEVLATYTEDLAVDGGETKAAVIYCKVGDGAAILTGPHPEYSGVNLSRDEPTHPQYGALIDALLASDDARTAFMKACLQKLDLAVSSEPQSVPSLSPLHLSSSHPGDVDALLSSLRSAGVLASDAADGREYIRGENDTFVLDEPGGRWSLNAVKDAVSAILPSTEHADADRLLDYNAITKHLVPHTSSPPSAKETPHFNHAAFYSHLSSLQSLQLSHGHSPSYGRFLLYGEVVTSTNTLLEKNSTLLSHLPIGTVACATTQVAGRGRGSNVWVSPPGSLIFSVVQRHPLSICSRAPVVFVQYLAALAIVQAIKSYDRGYHVLPVKLKWPNDIYAVDPTSSPSTTHDEEQQRQAYTKIGGILVTSTYAGTGDYTLVTGIGLNANNPASPTTSLSHLAKAHGLPAFQLEKLLAGILVAFEALYARFCVAGFSPAFEEMYHSAWLHSGQVVTLQADAVVSGGRDEARGEVRARITGITTDWGQLVAEEVDAKNQRTGRRFELQSDANSFDFFKGLLRRKI